MTTDAAPNAPEETGPETDDLSNVPDYALPSEGWYKGFVANLYTRPSKASGEFPNGKKMRTALIEVDTPEGERVRIYENFVLEGNGSEIAIRRYKYFVRSCGVDTDQKFETSDVEGKELYVLVKIQDGTPAYPQKKPVAAAFRPLDDPPDDDELHESPDYSDEEAPPF